MWTNVERLKRQWIENNSKKKFTDFFSANERNFQCDYPTFKAGGFSVFNIPTLHFQIHAFDFIKKLNYQMNSRLHTGSDKCVAELQALRGKELTTKYKVQKQQCRNPKCRQFFKGYVYLEIHVMKKNQPKKCLLFYTNGNALEELKDKADVEIRFMRKIKKKTLLQKHLDTAKKEFTENVRTELSVKVNMVKVS